MKIYSFYATKLITLFQFCCRVKKFIFREIIKVDLLQNVSQSLKDMSRCVKVQHLQEPAEYEEKKRR